MYSGTVAYAVKRIFFNLTPRAIYSFAIFNHSLEEKEAEWLEGFLSFEKADFEGIQIAGDHRSNAILFFEGFVKFHTGDTKGGRRCMVAALQAKHVDISFIDIIINAVENSPEKILEESIKYGVTYLPELEDIIEPLKKYRLPWIKRTLTFSN